MQTKDDLKKLLLKYINETISDKEKEDLFKSIGNNEKTEEWKALIKELSSELSLTGKYDEQEWEPEIRKILQQPAVKPAPVHPIRIVHRAWFRYAASIIVLLGLAGIWYATYNAQNPGKQEIVDIPVTQHILPGSDRAVLTLSDGSNIILNNAADGVISNQGNAKIIKLEDGKLTYEVLSGENASGPLYNTITTPRGGQYQVVLPDGTGVWLNCASSITFPAVFSENERLVKITGEAYFEVTHINTGKDKRAIPFIVDASDTRITVLGTHFNINAYGDEGAVKTTLAEGSIKVNNGINARMVKPGEQVMFVSSENKYITIKPYMEEVLAWKNGKFLFRSTSVQSIVRQISRWYDVDIHYKGDLSDIIFSGSISRKSDIEKLIELLELDGRVKFEINGRKLTVMRR